MRAYYDLHIHSCLSPCADNDMTPNNIVNMAKLANLTMIALTDHNSTKNCKAAVEIGKKVGVLVIPGMELCTIEEVHVVCLFPTIEKAETFEAALSQKRIRVRNRPEIFGDQIIMDELDREIGREEFLLVNAINISIGEVTHLVKEYAGAAFPAHIDKGSYSVLSSLGEIPPEAEFKTVEIFRKQNVEKLLKEHKKLSKMSILFNSDAHTLGQIGEKEKSIFLDEISIEALLAKINGNEIEETV